MHRACWWTVFHSFEVWIWQLSILFRSHLTDSAPRVFRLGNRKNYAILAARSRDYERMEVRMNGTSFVSGETPSRELVRQLRRGAQGDGEYMPENIIWRSYMELRRRDVGDQCAGVCGNGSYRVEGAGRPFSQAAIP